MNNSNVKQKLEIDNVGKYSLDTIKSYFDANQNLWDTNPAICLAKEYYKGKVVGLRVAELLSLGYSRYGALISLSECHGDDYADSIIRAVEGRILNIRVVESKQGTKEFHTYKSRMAQWKDIFVPLKFTLSDLKYANYDIYHNHTEWRYMSALVQRYGAIYNLVNLAPYIKPESIHGISINNQETFGDRPGYFSFTTHYKQFLQELNQGEA